ncbi:MAG: hypothetical protein ABI045_05710 [Flavobacteriales bacterium]
MIYTNGYIELSFLVKYYFGESPLRVFADLGGYLAYWVSSSRKK